MKIKQEKDYMAKYESKRFPLRNGINEREINGNGINASHSRSRSRSKSKSKSREPTYRIDPALQSGV